MACKISIVCSFLWIFVPIANGNDMLICKSTGDSIFDYGTDSCKETTGRIKALEEKVKQLQDVISSGSFSDKRFRYGDLPADCAEIFTNGTTTSGVYLISPDGRCPFKVYCNMTDQGWTLIQTRIDGAVNFYRTWNEYVEGFGDINGEHWLGLEKIHRLTRDGAEIYFDIENYDGSKDHAYYKSFIVHDVTTFYKMNVDPFGYEGTLTELFSYHDNQKFSTFDRDNDKSGSNCVDSLDGGGWWYNSCYKLGNPNGVFGKKQQGGIGYWEDGRSHVQVRTITIKVGQKHGMC